MVEATLKYDPFGLNPIDLLTKKFEELTRKLPDASQESDECVVCERCPTSNR